MTGAAPRRGARIAVVGGGAAGLTAAHLLQHRYDVTLFERERRPGGHVRTVVVDRGPDSGTPIDTGFIVFNERNYPLFSRMLGDLDVASQASDMSFSYSCGATGLEYAGTGFTGLAAQPRNLARLAYWRFLLGIARFCRAGRDALDEDLLDGATLGEFLDASDCPAPVARDYVLPLGAAIWSASRDEMRRFPAESFLRFFDNHGLLRLSDRPQWRTVVGGSAAYVEELLRRFRGRVVTGAPVGAIRREGSGVSVCPDDGEPRSFDGVVVATHADQALSLLERPTDVEARLLGAWRYSNNRAILHRDAAVMPRNRRAWASWNYQRATARDADAPVAVTYHMNRLQALRAADQYFVTLNPVVPVRDESVLHETRFTHPVFDFRAAATQPQLAELNGAASTWFCGSYFGYGFHEDAVRSATAVAASLGVAA